MSQVEGLVSKLCPSGVAFTELRNVCQIKNGKDWKAQEQGDIPVYGSGGRMEATVLSPSYDQPTVLLPRKGSLNVQYVEEPFWNVDTVFYTICDVEIVEPKFLFYYLKTVNLAAISTSSTRPSLTQTALSKIRVPVPPLPVQREIVRTLDKFTQLEAELEAELKARKTQYEYYRSLLLSYGEDCKWMTLGEAFALKAGKSIRTSEISAFEMSGRCIPCFGGNGVRGFVESHSHNGKFPLIGRQGALCGNVNWAEGYFYATEHAIVAAPHQTVDARWGYHMLGFLNLNQYATKSAQPGLSVARLTRIPFPLPDIKIQKEAAAILDKFDSVINDLNSGLPAELNARRKQYGYYRDRLLAFKELSV